MRGKSIQQSDSTDCARVCEYHIRMNYHKSSHSSHPHSRLPCAFEENITIWKVEHAEKWDFPQVQFRTLCVVFLLWEVWGKSEREYRWEHEFISLFSSRHFNHTLSHISRKVSLNSEFTWMNGDCTARQETRDSRILKYIKATIKHRKFPPCRRRHQKRGEWEKLLRLLFVVQVVR